MPQSNLIQEAGLLQAALPEVAVRAHACIDSTNSEAKRVAQAEGISPALIFADTQTNGRGRMGRSFFSPAQVGAYFSILYTPEKGLASVVSVTSAAAVAVMRAIRETCGIQTEIKWVNDLYYEGRKVCGILCESLTLEGKPYVIVGIGINLTTADFPTELREKAGALGTACERGKLIAAVYRALEPYLTAPDRRDWLDDYRMHSAVIGKAVTWVQEGVTEQGIALGIDADGGLEVQTADGKKQTLRTGEITLRLQK